MTNIEPTAEAWMDAVRVECPILPPISVATVALQRALLEIKINEQKLADCKQELSDFRQDVSDVVEQALSFGDVESLRRKGVLSRFIIPKPKPDPLVKIIGEINDGPYIETKAEYADRIRTALDALGFEIREKNNV
jgi:hypothetical protein